MKREDFNDFDEFSDEEASDFENNETGELKQKGGRDKKRENKRRLLDDFLEAKQLRADLGQYEAEAWSNDSYYDDILKDEKKSKDDGG